MDYFSFNDKVMRMIVNRGDLQLNVGSEPLLWWEAGNVHIPKVFIFGVREGFNL
jgi:hypothetical protein